MMSMGSLFARLRGHFQENVARYAVLALAILTPASGLLGTAAAHLGGANTQGGRIALGAASAVATAIAGVTFIRNLGIWQMLDRFGTAPQVITAAVAPTGPPVAPASPASAPVNVGATPVASAPPVELPTPDADSQDQLEATDGVPPEATADAPTPPAPPPPPTPSASPPPAPAQPAQAPAATDIPDGEL